MLAAFPVAVYFLLHLPAGCPGLLLATIVLCGVRTFLDLHLRHTVVGVVCQPRSPGQLIHAPYLR